jgi:SAM-dependent methyltransferase
MGLYSERVVPRLVNLTCGSKMAGPQRERVCAGLTGEVVEIGFGSGHNVPYYPASVMAVTAVEPSDVAWRLAADNLAGAQLPIRRAGLDGQALPFDDDVFDSALSSWTLCTIPDARAALQEIRRVLKPGGSFHFVEHGLAPDEPVRRWQHRLEPLQRRLFGGCHLTKPIADLITDAGFVITSLDVFYEPGAPKSLGAFTLGRADNPAVASREASSPD